MRRGIILLYGSLRKDRPLVGSVRKVRSTKHCNYLHGVGQLTIYRYTLVRQIIVPEELLHGVRKLLYGLNIPAFYKGLNPIFGELFTPVRCS